MVEQRPAYHLHPSANRMNDPNGPIRWNGRYHLFYQYNPGGAFKASARTGTRLSWAHAVSDDLVRWQHLPPALEPTPGGHDAEGCYSGCAVDADGVPTLVYTGVTGGRGPYEQHTLLATSADPDLRTWDKHPKNPVVSAPPEGLDVVGFRDPCVWREDGLWHQVVGSGIRGQGGTVFLYRSGDLVDWEYRGQPLSRAAELTEPIPTGTMWECPQFFALGDRHVLILSVYDDADLKETVYFVGTYADGRFSPETLRRFDVGADYYAPIFHRDGGRLLLWGWSWEGRSQAAQEAAGWAGVMSLPRVLTLRPDRTLGIEPAAEAEALRGPVHELSDLRPGAARDALAGLGGDCLEIHAELVPSDRPQGLAVRCSPDGRERTPVVYDRRAGTLSVDREAASADPQAYGGVHGGPLELADGEPLRLRVFLDRSIVEVYANGRACLTERIYPTRPDSVGIELLGDAAATSLRVWQLSV